jgi:NAD(P)-dependent dehydrogenase (short-subunit alcohol dehydrogenase family)
VGQLPWLKEGLWGLVPNAAVETLKKVTDYTHDDMMAMFKVNVVSPICLIQSCHPYLQTAKGSIVYVGSIANYKKEPRYSFYGGTKAFMKSFVGHAGQELGFDGIRINIVSPGATDTELMRDMKASGAWSEAHVTAFENSIPIEQRIGTPAEMADAIWFALSGPRFFHGEDLRVYGGHL